jgi:hypothetical protein
MPLDPYRLCPGGTNKKIKFCGCDKEVLGDLNRIIDAIDGEQRAAALGHANRSLEAHGNRACLLTLKGTVQLQMQDFEGLAKTTETFLEKHPDNPVALGMSAIGAAVQRESRLAITQTQRALQKADGKLPGIVYSAIGIVGRRLFESGDILAAMGHFLLQMGFSGQRDKQPIELLSAMYASNRIPLLLKRDLLLEISPSAGISPGEFNAALELAAVGRWAESCARFYNLAVKHPTEPALVKNMAILQGWLGDEQAAGQSWRKYAGLDGVDLELAVESEALAQMLVFADTEDHQIDEVTHTYPVTDGDQVLERLLSEKHIAHMPVDLQQMATEESPPPKAAFWLLDRGLPTATEGLQFHEVPNVLGEMYVYGKQTDREARVEFVSVKTTDFEAKLQKLKDLLGEFGGRLEKEETTGQVSATSAALTWQWRLPDNITVEQRQQLIEQKRRDVNLNVWPQTPLRELEGKRPAEVAADPAFRVRLLGAILLLDTAAEQSRAQFDYNELRAKLGLPLAEDLDPASLDVMQLSPVRLGRLPAEKLDDETLTQAFTRAFMYRTTRPLRRLGLEMVARESLQGKVDKSQIYELLGQVARDVDEALEFNALGRQTAEAAGESPAKWLLEELQLRLLKGESETAFQIMGRIQSNHLREPGVAEALVSLLQRLGLVNTDRRSGQAVPQAQPQGPALRAGAEPVAPGGKIWTPGSAAAGPPGEKKPGLWVPGM